MKFCFVLFSMIVLIFLELLLGNLALAIPLTGCGIFYFAVNGNWKWALFTALFAGLLLDLNFGRNTGESAYCFLLVVFFATFWKKHQTVRPLWLNAVPGALISGIVLLPQYVFILPRHRFQWTFFFDKLSFLFFAAMACALFLPLLILTLDVLAKQLALPRYLDVKLRDTRNES